MTPRSRIGDVTLLIHSFATKLVLLALIFVTVPVILYHQFQSADEEKNELLHAAVVQQSRLMAEALRPLLEGFHHDQPGNVQRAIERFAEDGMNVKLLLRPKNVGALEGFFYIASVPTVTTEYLEEERQQLLQLGVFDRLDEACNDDSGLSVRFANPAGQEEVLTSLESLYSELGCWVVITSQSRAAFLRTAIGRPFWQTTAMQVAGGIYILSAAIVIWLFADSWRNITLFRAAAGRIRLRNSGDTSFRRVNRIPELKGVAEDFDGLVEALTESQNVIQQAAEENAHALKTPLAIIAQSVEPLKRAVPADHKTGRRSIELIESSVERLDELVSAGRELDRASAETVYPRRWRMNLSAFVEKLLTAYGGALVPQNKRIKFSVEPGIYILASEDLLEPAIENLLENASSFAPPGTTLEVNLTRAGGRAELTIADHGPGIEPEHLEKIFERYFSHRPACDAEVSTRPRQRHFGLGLWIVKRNIEGLGGTVRVANRLPHGLQVIIDLPAAE